MTLAFVFPGQGSQSVGMLADFGDETIVRDCFAQASEVLDYDLWQLVSEGPRERLDATECTQPAMLTAGVALWRLWQQRGGPVPVVSAGHSLGEYTALTCAGAVDFGAAVELVRFRGRIMQEAVPAGSGAMAAVLGLDNDDVEAACREASAPGEVVETANYNAPGQVVVAGHSPAVARCIEAARARGARRAIELPVSVPSHTSLMQPAALRFGERLKGIALKKPGNDVYGVGPKKHGEPGEIRGALVEQLHRPIRWDATVRAMVDDDRVDRVVECGAGKVLVGLCRRIDRAVTVHTTSDREAFEAALAAAGGQR